MRRLVLVAVLAATMLLPSLAVAAEGTVTVQYGDTLTSIAARHGTTVDALVAENGLASANLIFVGQTLRVPGGASAAPAPAPAAPAPSGGGSYTIQPGDFLSVIAERHGISQDALMAANGISNPNLIFAGQRLVIPGGSAPAPAPAAPAPAAPAAPTGGGGTYTVRAGDNLADIAYKHGVTVDALLARNNIANANIIHTGQVINLPSGASAQPAPPNPPVAPQPDQPKPPDAPVQPPKPGPAPAPPPAAEQKPAPAAGETIKYTVQPGDRLYAIAAKYNTTVDAIVARNNIKDPNWISNGQVLTIQVGDKTSKPVQANSEVPQAAPNKALPPKNAPAGKWIDVNLSTQRLTAYEGDNAVYSTLVSTGLARYPTVVGTFKIYVKYRYDDMTGGYGADYYYLPNVPYTMYFYAGYAIHGTYWHNNFGRPMSHGCVNLPTDAAEWVYNWASVGTPVVTHW
jgi:LysM repeat protein